MNDCAAEPAEKRTALIIGRAAAATGLAFILTASPLAVHGQLQKVARIGVLSGDAPNDSPCVQRLQQGLGELGYVEGKTHVLELRWAEGRSDVFPSLAADLVRMNVDLIVSAAGPAALAVKEATSSIPIVLASSFYPVELGIIASLAHPGGNVTGVTHFTPELMAKRVQLLKELLPRASHFGVLRLPGGMQDFVVRDMEAAARQLGVQLQVIQVRRVEDLAPAFDSAVASHAQAIMSTQGPFFVQNNARIAQLALKHRLPSLSGEPNAAEDGALLFYGPNVFEGCARAAKYVDRILKGAKPADLPVEQPTRIDFVINLKTARTLGVTVPPPLLQRADRVIQ
jgi:putative tryptophan/tyrosine transport system substrate-binding protein